MDIDIWFHGKCKDNLPGRIGLPLSLLKIESFKKSFSSSSIGDSPSFQYQENNFFLLQDEVCELPPPLVLKIKPPPIALLREEAFFLSGKLKRSFLLEREKTLFSSSSCPVSPPPSTAGVLLSRLSRGLAEAMFSPPSGSQHGPFSPAHDHRGSFFSPGEPFFAPSRQEECPFLFPPVEKIPRAGSGFCGVAPYPSFFDG